MMTLFNDEEIMDAYTEDIRMEEKRKTAVELSDMGLSPEKIARAVKVSVNTVKQWLKSGAVTAQ